MGQAANEVNGPYATTGTAFTTLTQNISAFTVWNSRFNFGLVYAGFDPQGDGFGFVLQSVGPTATGDGGSGIGFEGMANSAGGAFRSLRTSKTGNSRQAPCRSRRLLR